MWFSVEMSFLKYSVSLWCYWLPTWMSVLLLTNWPMRLYRGAIWLEFVLCAIGNARKMMTAVTSWNAFKILSGSFSKEKALLYITDSQRQIALLLSFWWMELQCETIHSNKRHFCSCGTLCVSTFCRFIFGTITSFPGNLRYSTWFKRWTFKLIQYLTETVCARYCNACGFICRTKCSKSLFHKVRSAFGSLAEIHNCMFTK